MINKLSEELYAIKALITSDAPELIGSTKVHDEELWVVLDCTCLAFAGSRGLFKILLGRHCSYPQRGYLQ